MSRIQSLDEITDRLGKPVFLRWVEAPYGAAAAVVRFRHRGAVVDISASSNFRLIFHLSPSQIVHQDGEQLPSQNGMPIGSIVASFTHVPERIRILSAADTLHLLFSPELSEACLVDVTRRLSPRTYPALRAGAVQTLVAAAFGGTDAQMQQAIASVARTIVDNYGGERLAAGGLAPQASRAIHELIEKHLRCGVSVPELAEAAGLSVHHFIKSSRHGGSFISVACWCSGISPLLSLSPGRVETWISKGRALGAAKRCQNEGSIDRMERCLRLFSSVAHLRFGPSRSGDGCYTLWQRRSPTFHFVICATRCITVISDTYPPQNPHTPSPFK